MEGTDADPRPQEEGGSEGDGTSESWVREDGGLEDPRESRQDG